MAAKERAITKNDGIGDLIFIFLGEFGSNLLPGGGKCGLDSLIPLQVVNPFHYSLPHLVDCEGNIDYRGDIFIQRRRVVHAGIGNLA